MVRHNNGGTDPMVRKIASADFGSYASSKANDHDATHSPSAGKICGGTARARPSSCRFHWPCESRPHRAAAYCFFQRQPRHALSFKNWQEAQRLGVELPEAAYLLQPPSPGRVISLPQVGGLHHRYERRAA